VQNSGIYTRNSQRKEEPAQQKLRLIDPKATLRASQSSATLAGPAIVVEHREPIVPKENY